MKNHLSQNTTEKFEYTPLSPLPGTYNKATNKSDLVKDYLPGLFTLVIGLAAVIAVAKIIWGGIEYITTDAIGGKKAGKEKIVSAVIGLVIVACSYLILETINPKLLELNLNIEPSTVPISGAVVPSGQCVDCEIITGMQIVNTGPNVSHQIAANLQNLNNTLKGKNINMSITEANPPTGKHADACHSNGTCVDAKIPGLDSITQAEADKINQVYNAAKASGFSQVIFEVKTSEEIAAWAKLGVKAYTTPNTTGSHFHIEK